MLAGQMNVIERGSPRKRKTPLASEKPNAMADSSCWYSDQRERTWRARRTKAAAAAAATVKSLAQRVRTHRLPQASEHTTVAYEGFDSV